MRGLTVHQPWAAAIIHHGKNVENRRTHWTYRGALAIHAGMRWSRLVPERNPRLDEAFGHHLTPPCEYQWSEHVHPGYRHGEFTYGAILGTVQLVGIHRDNGCCRPWGDPDCLHLELAYPRPLDNPIPCRGKQGLWILPTEVLDPLLAVTA